MTYSKDLAFIHDEGFGNVAINAGILIDSYLKNKQSKCLVVDLGCGSGIMARELLKKGYNVYGIDISESMINLAKRKAPKAEFKVGSYLNEKIPKCHAITSIGEGFNYLFDERVNLKTLTQLFEKCYHSLERNGILVFDILETSHHIDHSSKSFKTSKLWAVTAENIENKETKTLKRVITSFVKHGKDYERTDEIHKITLYEQRNIAEILKKIGFKVKIQNNYGELTLRPGCSVYICKKITV